MFCAKLSFHRFANVHHSLSFRSVLYSGKGTAMADFSFFDSLEVPVSTVATTTNASISDRMKELPHDTIGVILEFCCTHPSDVFSLKRVDHWLPCDGLDGFAVERSKFWASSSILC